MCQQDVLHSKQLRSIKNTRLTEITVSTQSDEFAKLLLRTLVQLEMLTSSVFLETSMPNIPSITVLSFHLVSAARTPLRATLYAGSTLMRVPGYRPV